jgi:hypothetical protein
MDQSREAHHPARPHHSPRGHGCPDVGVLWLVPSPSPAPGLAGPPGAVGAVGVAALKAAGALAGQPVGAVGAVVAGMIAHVRVVGWLAGVAFAIQLDHHVGTQGGVLLLAADPLMQLGRSPFPGWEGARVERHKHRVQRRGGRSAAALAGGGDGALPDRVGVAGPSCPARGGKRLA